MTTDWPHRLSRAGLVARWQLRAAARSVSPATDSGSAARGSTSGELAVASSGPGTRTKCACSASVGCAAMRRASWLGLGSGLGLGLGLGVGVGGHLAQR